MNWFQRFMSIRLCSMRNGIHKNFVKFKGNHMWQNLFFKVARVVRLKLTFMELFFYSLVILIKLYKIWYLDLDKALLFPKTQGIWLKNWKLWRLPLKFCARFLLNNVYKKIFGIFSILFRSWVINKNIKTIV